MSARALRGSAARPLAACLMLASALTACGEAPIVGAWRSDAKLGNGERNELQVNSDFRGEATLYVTPKSNLELWTRLSFDLIWEDEGAEFDVELECKDGPCNGDDFRMECTLISEAADEVDKMDCQGRGKWADYPLDWERDQ